MLLGRRGSELVKVKPRATSSRTTLAYPPELDGILLQSCKIMVILSCLTTCISLSVCDRQVNVLTIFFTLCFSDEKNSIFFFF